MGGTSLPIIGKSLGHTQAQTTMIYARLQLDSIRDSVTAATTAIMEAGNISLVDGNVVIDAGSVKLLKHEQAG
jgi:hypothetical protein